MICYEHMYSVHIYIYTLLRYRGALLPFYLFFGGIYYFFPSFSNEMMERNVRTPA